MLIVEGPDGAGKTTLITRLATELELPIAPRVVSKDAEAMVDLVEWVNQDLARGLKKCIYDRHRLISEPIYGPVLRSAMEPGFDRPGWLRNKQLKLRLLEPFVVFCLPPLEQVRKNVSGDEDNQVVHDSIDLIYWLYYNAAASWPWPTAVWDYTQDDVSYRGNTYYDLLKSNITRWMWEKGMYDGRW